MNYKNIEEIIEISTQTKDIIDNPLNSSSQKKQKSRIIEFNEDGTIDEMLTKFLNKVKPIVDGVIIFKTLLWKLFPQSKEESMKIGKNWSIAFSKKKSHKNVKTNIYFDKLKSTITFKIKPFILSNILIRNKKYFYEIKNEIIANIILYFKENNIIKVSKMLSYEIESCENYPENNIFRQESKIFATELENNLKEENYNYIVVVFMKNYKINVTLKNLSFVIISDRTINNETNIMDNK
jgi:hypothetical protein